MVPFNIEELLEKYWKAETSLEEEKALKAYFSQSEIEPRFKQEQALFNFFVEEEKLEMDAEIKLPEAKVISIAPKSKKRNYSSTFGIAASIALIAAIVFTVKPFELFTKKQMSSVVIEHENPEEALEDLKIALAYISGKMNQSIGSANIGLEKVNEISKLINGETL